VQVIGVAHGSLTAVQLVKKHQPDVLLIDANIPVEEAIAILHNIKLENPSVLIAIIADTNHDQRSLTKAGANYVVSTYEFKSKMQDIFNQFRETYPNVSGNIKDAFGTNI
jgi:chemotaxis response regulator CheB